MQHADTVYLNGLLYTGDAQRRFAQALATQGGKIIAVGRDDDIRPLAGPATRIVDLAGRLMLPGLIDGHVHPLEGHQILGDFDLSGINDPDTILQRIRACADATPNEPWVYLGGANLAAFGAYPTRELLDRIVPDRPLLVVGFDVHSGCLNTKGRSGRHPRRYARPDRRRVRARRVRRAEWRRARSGVLPRVPAHSATESGRLPEVARESARDGARLRSHRLVRRARRGGRTQGVCRRAARGHAEGVHERRPLCEPAPRSVRADRALRQMASRIRMRQPAPAYGEDLRRRRARIENRRAARAVRRHRRLRPRAVERTR